MALIIPPGYAQCSVQMLHASVTRPAYITLGVDWRTVGGDFAGAVVGFGDNLIPALDDRVDSNVTFGPIIARVGSDDGALVYEDTRLTAGARNMASASPSVSVLVEKRTARGGRRGRGRMFVPWACSVGSASDTDEAGKLSSAAITAWVGTLATIMSNFAADATPLVILHNTGDTTPGAPDPIISLGVDPVVGLQRRRQGR